MEQVVKAESLFDRSARDFAANIDALIASGGYARGDLFVRAVMEAVPRGGHILDYGCGPGRLARLIAAEGYRVHALDPSTGMLAVAREQAMKRLDIIFEQLRDNGESLEHARYDGIVCSSTIEYVPDAAALLGHFHRALKSAGVLIISYANRASFWRKYSEIRGRDRAPHLKLQHNIWRFREFTKILSNAGFEVESGPVYFDVAPFDKWRWLRGLSSLPFLGTLGLVIARPKERKL